MTTDEHGPTQFAQRSWRPGPLEYLAIGLVALLLGQSWLVSIFDQPAVQTGATIFVAIIVQALPFLVLGVLLSAAIAAFVPPSVWQKALPKNQVLAVPVAGAAGFVLPGCECASVPVAGSLMARGVAPAAALAFLLSAPAINPIVLVSTFVAFPGNPQMMVARLIASLATSIIPLTSPSNCPRGSTPHPTPASTHAPKQKTLNLTLRKPILTLN